jgi:hypothetical protein
MLMYVLMPVRVPVSVLVRVHGAVRVAMDVSMRRVGVLAGAFVDVPVHGAVGSDVLMLVRITFHAGLAQAAAASRAHRALLIRSRCP